MVDSFSISFQLNPELEFLAMRVALSLSHLELSFYLVFALRSIYPVTMIFGAAHSILIGFILGMSQLDAPMTLVEDPQLVCVTPGSIVYVNKTDERMWISTPHSDYGLEPTISKILATGKSSLYIEAQAELNKENVSLVFTLKELIVSGDIPDSALRAQLRVFDSFGEESAVIRFRCDQIESW